MKLLYNVPEDKWKSDVFLSLNTFLPMFLLQCTTPELFWMEPSLTQAGTEETLSHSNWDKVYIFWGCALVLFLGVVVEHWLLALPVWCW
jgi:hypothetical protein